MAVLPMKKISIYGLKADRKKILELLQRRGVIEATAVGVPTGEIFSLTDTQNAKNTFDDSIKALSRSLEVLDSVKKPEKGLLDILNGRDGITLSEYNVIADSAVQTVKDASEINALGKKIADSGAQITRKQTALEALTPWLGLDISMRTLGTDSTSVFIGSLPDDYTEESLKEKLAVELPDVDGIELEVISHNVRQTCVFAICHAKYGIKLEGALRAMGLTYPAAADKDSPREKIAALKEEISNLYNETELCKKEIASYADKRKDILYTIDYFTMRTEKYDVLGTLWQSKHIFIISGYIPMEDSEKLVRELESSFECYAELESPEANEDVPVKLKNNRFSAPVESVTESYSLPGHGECDPTSITAIFYYVLFGMMLSDAAYGLIMLIGCAVVLAKYKNIEGGIKKTLTLFLYCGISTTFWGILFGSFFGDAIEVVGKTFFNQTWLTPCLWYKPLNNPMRLLMFSFLLGIIHLFAGLAMKLYQLCRQRKFLDALYDVVFWYMLVGGLIFLFITTDLFKNMANLSFAFPSWIGTAGAIVAAVGALGIIFTSGRESKNPFKRLLKGLYGLYGVSGYLSDILSYSRLLALGLATGVIASVFNQMGSMLGGGIPGAIVFTLVFVVGHSLNIGINLLGAYVHTNRLQFVEFFGKFYEGGGCKFNPFSAKTKYFKITEEK